MNFKFFVFLLLVVLSHGIARAGILWKFDHEKWAEKEFSNPDCEAEELAAKALHIIVYNLHDDPSKAWLEIAKSEIPEIGEYLVRKTSGIPDSLFLRERNAVRAISDYLGKKSPESFSYFTSRYYNAVNQGLISKNTSDWDELINELSNALQKNNSLELKALLVLAKIERHNNSLLYKDSMTPEDYILMAELENEALKIYPLENTDLSLTKARLYNMLGHLKYNVEDDVMAYIYNKETATDFKPFSEYIGSFPTNSKDYFRRAAVISKSLLNPGHPLVISYNLDLIAFDNSLHGVEPNRFKEEKELYDYLDYTSPASGCELNNEKVQYVLNALIMRENCPQADHMEEAIDVLKAYFGEEHPTYLKTMKTVAGALPLYGINADYWINRLIQECEANGIGKGSEDLDLTLFDINSKMFEYSEEALQNIYKIEENYKRNHSSSPQSIRLGALLSRFRYSNLYDTGGAIEIMDIILGDLQNQFGSDVYSHPDWWRTFIERTNMSTDNYSTSQIENTYKNIIKFYEKNKSPYNNKYLWMAVNSYGNYLTNNVEPPRYEEAKDLIVKYAQIGREVRPYEDFVIYGILSYLENAAKGDKEKVKGYALKSLGVADSCFLNNDHLRLRYPDFDLTVTALTEIGEVEEAIKGAELKTEVYLLESQNQFTLDYFYHCIEKAKLYKAGNRINDARRLIAECVRQVKMIPDLAASPFLLDCLWEEYYITRSGNIDDIGSSMSKMMNIIEKTQELKDKNYKIDENILYNYYIMGLVEMLELMADIRSNLDNLKIGISDDYIKYIDASIEKIDKSGLIEMAEEIYDEYPSHYPNYLKEPNYHGFSVALAKFYNASMDKEKAMKIYQDILESEALDATKLVSLAELLIILWQNNDLNKFPYYIRLYESILNGLTYRSDDDIFVLDNIAVNYYMRIEDYNQALKYARNFYNHNRHILDENFQLMTNNEQNSYMDKYGDPAYFLCRVLEMKPQDLAGEVYDAVLYRTGMKMRSQRATKEAIEKNSSPRVKEMLDSIDFLNEKLKNEFITRNNYSFDDPARMNSTKTSDEILQQIDYLEGKVLEATKDSRPARLPDISWRQIKENLSPGQVAIEFVYADTSFYALVLKPDFENPQPLKLGSQANLINLLNSLETTSSAGLSKKLYPAHSHELYNLLWHPLEDILSDVGIVYYSLPGILNNLSFNAFMDEEGNYLFDRFDLIQLTTTAQLVFDDTYQQTNGVAAMGNILYSENQKVTDKEEARNRATEDMDFRLVEDPEARGLIHEYFRYLPFTSDELNDISSLFQANNFEKAELHEATEQQFRKMVENHPDILHLATHGFYIASADDAANMPFFKNKGVSSMTRSGIALAGAEEAWRGLSDVEESRDGILTAEEVSLLDLKGTSLIVLSACETALGDYSFEGIFGLQRGFKQAGVKSMLLSLWSVNDHSTSLFMKTFYSELNKTQNKQQAWREAIKTVRESFPAPYYWAPFILLDPV